MRDSYEHGRELTCFLKGGEFFGQMSEYRLLKDDCTV
jgi:hypothetical protein